MNFCEKSSLFWRHQCDFRQKLVKITHIQVQRDALPSFVDSFDVENFESNPGEGRYFLD